MDVGGTPFAASSLLVLPSAASNTNAMDASGGTPINAHEVANASATAAFVNALSLDVLFTSAGSSYGSKAHRHKKVPFVCALKYSRSTYAISFSIFPTPRRRSSKFTLTDAAHKATSNSASNKELAALTFASENALSANATASARRGASTAAVANCAHTSPAYVRAALMRANLLCIARAFIALLTSDFRAAAFGFRLEYGLIVYGKNAAISPS
mmetsp:Transcript_6588/g.26473  ORF Transcript_6588/g.26473 Transcript_6588/m.26473 type:complete len:213 (-) Transcript_6588:2926-3564(-)